MKGTRILTAATCVLLLTAMPWSIAACSDAAAAIEATDLTEGFEAHTVEEKPTDDVFIDSAASFAMELFKQSIDESENSLISPLSVSLALSMTANGADGDTRAQMEQVLGSTLTVEDLNSYLHTYTANLESTDAAKLEIANSIWFKDDESLTFEETFLQTNADYYDAALYEAPFDTQTLEDINNWVDQNTDGHIDRILNEIPEKAIMYLINAIAFDATWETPYESASTHEGTFTAVDGSEQNVTMMSSTESRYLDDGDATGFIKPYADGQYSFVALLPHEDIPIEDYVSSLTGQRFLDTIEHAENTAVKTTMPKFAADYSLEMSDVLKSLGMTDAFDASGADFSRLGQGSDAENIFISRVLHKTYILVDEEGTEAAAVTGIEISTTSAPMEPELSVTLDRPFVYAIIDNDTGLPLFIGTEMNIQTDAG